MSLGELQRRAAEVWGQFERREGARVLVGTATCGRAAGALQVAEAFRKEIARNGLNNQVLLAEVGCLGICYAEPLVEVRSANGSAVLYSEVSPRLADKLVESHFIQGQPLVASALAVMSGEAIPQIPPFSELPMIRRQERIILRNCGVIDPTQIDHALARGAYTGLARALEMGSQAVIAEVTASGLRGRGGAGFPTGPKWSFAAKSAGDEKYVICNADEGDPGAFMNRSVLEGDPHAVLEGLTIAGWAIGAHTGYIYVRAEYPLAIERLQTALGQMRDYGLLGRNILGAGFDFDIHIKQGAGAFVCGEETALMASIEGRRGMPRSRPPFPANSGLFGKPTNINNVETLAAVSVILQKGGAWYAQFGTEKSRGTKTFSLAGKIERTGLIEVPLGTPLRTIIYEVGGGVLGGKGLKAVQTGGPSGGCIPAELLDTPVDYEHLAQAGSIMGSGGLVVMDEDSCMVDVARYFQSFTESESCGKCVPCRMGTQHVFRILTEITQGRGTPAHLIQLQGIAETMRKASLCGLGQTAPNPVLTTLRHFRTEYEDHMLAHHCQAGVCQDLALSPCENSCPLRMNIPRFIQLYQENRIEEAFLSVVLDNPLPASTGRVCQHHCGKRCRRQTLDESLNIRDIHRHIADAIYLSERFDRLVQHIAARKLEATGRKVAVAGAGPAGLTAAFYLALMGHDITVFDERPEAGGMLRFAIPEYRLPEAVLRREIELIERMGVKFVFNTRVGFDLPLNELADRFDAVFISIGTWKESSFSLPGTELKGVHHALTLLEEMSREAAAPIGRKVAVIGGGNAAIDSARSALRSGADVTIYYRRERKDMPAIEEETTAAEEEGVRFVFLAAPYRIIGDQDGHVRAIEVEKTRLGEYDRSGRRKPVSTGEIQRFECDTVVLAVGETFDLDFGKASGLELKKEGAIAVNRFTLETSRPGFYAGGDVITGASNVSTAMGYGKQGARNIDEGLMGEGRWAHLFPEFAYGQQVPVESCESRRHEAHALAPKLRILSNDEVVTGFTAEEALEEASRCLRCDIKTHVSAS